MNKEEFLKECAKEGLIIYGNTWESNLKRLKELKKHKEMWEEMEGFFEPGKIFVVPEEYLGEEGGVMQYIVKTIKQTYFPKPFNKTHQLLMELDELVQETLRLLGG